MLWSYPQVRCSLPVDPTVVTLFFHSDVRIFYAVSPDEAQRYAKEILKLTADGFSVWGFDAEWRMQFIGRTMHAHKVGLIQMYRDDVVILFHITASGIPNELIDVLAHPRIFKVGLNIGGDVSKLARDYDFLSGKINGVIEVRKFAAMLGITPASSLAGMVEQLMHKTLPKPQHIRCGNWDQVPLPSSWRHYAALDAFASLAVMKAAFAMHLATTTSPIDRSNYLLELLEKASKIKLKIEPRRENETTTPLKQGRAIILNDALLSCVEAFERIVPSTAHASVLPDYQKYCLAPALSGKSIAEIAEMRKLKTSTVFSYMTGAVQLGCSYDYNSFAITESQRNAVLTAFLTAHAGNPAASTINSSEIYRIASEASSNDGCGVEYKHVRFLRLHWQRNLGADWLSKLASLNKR